MALELFNQNEKIWVHECDFFIQFITSIILGARGFFCFRGEAAIVSGAFDLDRFQSRFRESKKVSGTQGVRQFRDMGIHDFS